jgi:hypothetical protein
MPPSRAGGYVFYVRKTLHHLVRHTCAGVRHAIFTAKHRSQVGQRLTPALSLVRGGRLFDAALRWCAWRAFTDLGTLMLARF